MDRIKCFSINGNDEGDEKRPAPAQEEPEQRPGGDDLKSERNTPASVSPRVWITSLCVCV